MRVFVYGSLLDPTVLAHRAGTPGLGARMIPALLAGHRRTALRASRFPTLRRDPNHVVQGAVISLGAAALRRLSAYETPRYLRVQRIVGTPSGPCRASVWIAAGATRNAWGEK